MTRFEYKAIPAPTKGLKTKDVKGPEGRFAFALEAAINEMAQDSWEYQRAETLPSVERSGLTGTTTEWRHVLIFRRVVPTASNAPTSIESPVESEPFAAGRDKKDDHS